MILESWMLGIDNQVSSQVQNIGILTNFQVFNSLSKCKVIMLNAVIYKGNSNKQMEKSMTIHKMLEGSLGWDLQNKSSKFWHYSVSFMR